MRSGHGCARKYSTLSKDPIKGNWKLRGWRVQSPGAVFSDAQCQSSVRYAGTEGERRGSRCKRRSPTFCRLVATQRLLQCNIFQYQISIVPPSQNKCRYFSIKLY